MDNFDGALLPHFFAQFLVGVPTFTASKVTLKSGAEIVFLESPSERMMYDLRCRISQKQLHEFLAFFRARRGTFASFCLKDPMDHTAQGELLGYGDSIRREFTFTKTYPDHVNEYKRHIALPIPESVRTSVPIAFTICNHKLAFVSPPAQDQAIICDFNFWVKARFCEDSFTYEYLPDGSVALKACIKEV